MIEYFTFFPHALFHTDEGISNSNICIFYFNQSIKYLSLIYYFASIMYESY